MPFCQFFLNSYDTEHMQKPTKHKRNTKDTMFYLTIDYIADILSIDNLIIANRIPLIYSQNLR